MFYYFVLELVYPLIPICTTVQDINYNLQEIQEQQYHYDTLFFYS